jgi:hypothetical protein
LRAAVIKRNTMLRNESTQQTKKLIRRITSG